MASYDRGVEHRGDVTDGGDDAPDRDDGTTDALSAAAAAGADDARSPRGPARGQSPKRPLVRRRRARRGRALSQSPRPLDARLSAYEVDQPLLEAGRGAGLEPTCRPRRLLRPVEPARPGRVRLRQPRRADPAQHREEDRRRAHERLRLQEGDRREEDVQRDDAGEEEPAEVPGRLGGGERLGDDEAEAGHHHAENRRVDRVATLLRPVDVAQVEDERELVEDEGRADPENDCADVADCRPCARLRKDHEAGDEHEHDPDHDVMEVNAADAAASPAAVARTTCVAACAGERDQECEEQQEQRLLALVENDPGVSGDEPKEVHNRATLGSWSRLNRTPSLWVAATSPGREVPRVIAGPSTPRRRPLFTRITGVKRVRVPSLPLSIARRTGKRAHLLSTSLTRYMSWKLDRTCAPEPQVWTDVAISPHAHLQRRRRARRNRDAVGGVDARRCTGE